MQKHEALKLALEYAALGIPAFPINAKKVPAVGAGGFRNGTTNPDKLHELFESCNGDIGVGLWPGPAGYMVLDVDTKDPKKDGFAALRKLQEENGALPSTAIAKTASGGWHIWYNKNGTFVDNSDLASGINVRADEGYVVAPGTYFATGKRWSWEPEREFDEVVQWPMWLEERLQTFARDTGKEHWQTLDRSKLNELDALMLDKMIALGGTHPRLQNGVVYLTRPKKDVNDSPSSNGVSIGFIGPGVAKIWTDGWVTPHGEFPSGLVINIFELDHYLETGELPEAIVKKEEVPAEFKHTGKFPFLKVSQVKKLTRPDYLIKKWLVKDTVSMLVAPTDTGKTFQAIDWAMCIALGIDWNGYRIKKAFPVMYVIGESQNSFGNRLLAWQLHHERTEDPDNFYTCPVPVNLFDLESTNSFISQLKELDEPPALIVIDTLARSAVGAEENSARDMGVVLANADRLRQATGACVLLVHHTGHENKGRGRGSSAIEAALINSFLMERVEGHIQLTNVRQKEGPKEDGFALRLEQVVIGEDEDGDEITSCVMVTDGPAVDRIKIKKTWFDSRKAKVVQALQQTGAISPATAVGAGDWQKKTGIQGKSNFDEHRKMLVKYQVVNTIGAGPATKYWCPNGDVFENIIPSWANGEAEE